VITSFKLLGHTIRVKEIPETEWRHEDCVGLYEPHRQRILIRGGLTDSLRWHTVYHEMVHAILGAMGHELNNNENFVDMVAGLLHQALSTAKVKH